MDLIKIEENSNLTKQYQTMLSEISEYYPTIQKASSNFYKSQSQFMDNMFSVHQPTKLRSLRQILAEVDASKLALEESYFSLRKKKLELRKKQFQLDKSTDEFEKELLQIELEEIETGLKNSKNYVNGAIRKVHAYLAQYKSILKKIGKESFTEEDFEIDECRYHVMTAFDQGLCAARAHGGVIDEGNHIYFFQIGVSGTAAQFEVSTLLIEEGKMLESGKIPDHLNTINWLERMGDKYAHCPINYAKVKGITIYNKDSLNE